MPDARTMHSPYPSGQGAASVPVLFTLPNVQPVIAAASVNPEGVARASRPATELEATTLQAKNPEATNNAPNTSLNTHTGSASGSASPSITSTYGKKSPGSGSKIGHVTNALIGVLLLAVVSLTIRNFAPTKSVSGNNPEPSNATATLANSSSAISSATSPATSQSAVNAASVPTGTHTVTAPVLVASKPSDIRHSDAAAPGIGGVDAPADSISSVSEKNWRSSSTQEASEESSGEPPESREENLAGSASSVPTVPTLLPAKEPKAGLGGGATLQYPQPANDGSAVATGPYGTNAATIPAENTPALSSTSSNSVASSTQDLNESAAAGSPQPRGNVSLTSGPNRYVGNSSTGIPNAVDSDTPSLNTRDMINLRNGQRSAKGILGGTTTVRNPAARGQEAMNPTQSMLMSGETYPPVRKHYEPINIPSNGTQAPAAYQPVYQTALPSNTAPSNTAPSNTAPQPGGLTNGQGIAASGNVITQPRVPYSGSALSAGSPAPAAPSNATQQRPLQPYTPLTPTLPMPDGSGLAPSTPNR